MVSEFVVVWVELNWLRDVAGSAFFGEKGRLTGWLFMAVVCVGLLGSWMSRQRCAGRLVGEAEFACGLTVGVWGRRRCAGRQGGKAEFACGLPVGVWGRRRCAGRQGGKVGVPCDLMGVSE